MKVKIVSDLTLEPIVKRLKDMMPGWELDFSYADNILLYLHANLDALYDCDRLIIHTDIFFSSNTRQYDALLDMVLTSFSEWAGIVLIPNQAMPYSAGPMKQSLGTGNLYQLSGAVQKIKESGNIYFYDFQYKIKEIGTLKSFHFSLGHLYQMPYTREAQNALAECWYEYLLFFAREEKKVIALDCDNTLWGGILGEDGESGLQIDRNAHGIVFLHFQEFLKQKKDEGFLLCLCSKNNADEVEAAFRNLKMPLQYDDFIVKKVNWKDKYINLRETASELNVGLNSFIFIDDSDFEAGLVEELVPEVCVIRFSNDYAAFRKLTGSLLFGRKKVLAEDIAKTETYRAEQLRKDVEKSAAGLDEFIKTLEIDADFKINDLENIDRLSQLTEKTNQFNFNKIPYSVNALKAFINQGNTIISGRVRDKFGDYGIVGLMLVERLGGGQARLHNFLMSCRTLGRGVEDKFLGELSEWLEKNKLRLSGYDFGKTEKNAPAELFLPQIKTNFGLD